MEIELYRRGIDLFNAGEFYDAHEVLEDVWRAHRGPEKLFLQALIQVAVALHHHSTGNLVGARSLMKRAARNFSKYPNYYLDIQLITLRQSLAEWQEALAEGKPTPPPPKI